MPSYDQSLLVLVLDEVLGLEAHEEDDGLGLLLEVTLGVPDAGEFLGDDVEGGTEGDIGCLDRRAGRVAGEAVALFPHRVLEEVDGVLVLRGEPAEQDDGRERERDERADEAVADQRRGGRSRTRCWPRRRSPRRARGCLRLPRTGWRRSMPSSSCMRALPQCTAPMPMREQRQGDPEADEEVVQPDRLEVLRDDRERHVCGDGEDAADDRQVEEGVDRALGALLLLRVEVGDAVPVRGETRVRRSRPWRRPPCRPRCSMPWPWSDESAAASSLPLLSSCAMVLLRSSARCHHCPVPSSTRAVIHTVSATMAPRPKIQRNRPSATGPSEPRAESARGGVVLHELERAR